MTKKERRNAKQDDPVLRVFYGDLADGYSGDGATDRDGSSHTTDDEIETFWAGRLPAARISARVAA